MSCVRNRSGKKKIEPGARRKKRETKEKETIDTQTENVMKDKDTSLDEQVLTKLYVCFVDMISRTFRVVVVAVVRSWFVKLFEKKQCVEKSREQRAHE